MDQIGPTAITIITSIVGLAMLAVILSQRANTSTVISSSGSALASVIGAAVAPLGTGNAGATSFSSNSNNIGGISL
jgi:PRD1 phage membrane DNA delivery